MAYSSLLRPITRGLILVATHHIHLDAHVLQLGHGLFGMGFKGLAHFKWQVVGLGKVDVLVGNGQRSRLVYHHSVHPFKAFKRRRIFYQHVHLCRLANGHHQSRGRGQTHSTRTSDDQHGNSRENGLRKGCISAQQPPQKEGYKGYQGHRWHKNTCHTVYRTLHGSLAALGLLHHLDNLGQGRMFANLLRLKPELALRHHRSSQHFRALLFQSRGWFARYHTLVYICAIGRHKALRLGYNAIDRHFLAGANLQHVAHGNGGNRHIAHFVAVDKACGLGCKSHQLPNAACRLVFGALFEQSTCKYKGDNHYRGIEIGVPNNASRPPNGIAPEGVERTEKESDACR